MKAITEKLPGLRAVWKHNKCTAFKLTAEHFGKYAAP